MLRHISISGIIYIKFGGNGTLDDNSTNDVSLFSDDGQSPTLPSSNIQSSSKELNPIKPDDLEGALKGDTVKSLLIPETLDLVLPNYVLDFRKAGKLRKHQISALATMLSEDGDVAIYVSLPDGIDQIGMAISTTIDRVLPAGITSIFGDNCTLYKDVQRGQPLMEIKQNDVKSVRLQL